MSIVCDPCVGLILPSSFEENCSLITDDCRISNIWASLCDAVPDALNQAAIDELETAGKIKKLPISDMTLTPNTSNKVYIGGCKYIAGNTTWTGVIRSYSRSEGIDDSQYYFDLYKARTNLTLLWQTCEGKYIINQELAEWNNSGGIGTIPAAPIGINASIVKPPNLQRDDTNELCYWEFEIEFRHNGVLLQTELPGVVIGG